MWFKASAPGSLMVLGEYSVLQGGNALVAAVNKRISVQLSERKDSLINITSALGHFQTDLSKFVIQSPFQFVLTTLKKYLSSLQVGCDITIESEFSDQVGFASSAAVTVATLAVLDQWLNIQFSQSDLIKTARTIIREVQGIGSGADVSACVLGGVVAYCAEPFFVEKFSYDYPITVIYSGSKTKTAAAIQHVQQTFASDPQLLQQIYQSINDCAISGIKAVRDNNHIELAQAMNTQQLLMEQLQVNTHRLDEIIAELKNHATILGAKISGSGLGDCVLALGNLLPSCNDMIPCQIDMRGVCYEKN